ncbi:MAG: hypothetical protein ACOY4R_10740 [Pseudomonadota bacterium]
MTEQSSRRPQAPPVEQVPGVAGGTSALASADAPFIYFDLVPNFGLNGGVANITLQAVRFHPTEEGGVIADRVTVAHLRMSFPAVQALKAAINGIELLAQPAPGGRN